jgi:hypothetical protein
MTRMKLATIGMAMMLLSATAVLADAVLRSVHRRCEAEVSLDPWELAGRGVFLMPRATKVLVAVAIATTIYSATTRAYDKDAIKYRQHIMSTLNEQSAALGQILSTSIPGDNALPT